MPKTPMKSTDCWLIVARLCADHKIKKKKKKKKSEKSANNRRKKKLGIFDKNDQPTRKQPKSTVASYVLFWLRRRRPLVGLGNVTALQEQKLSTEVRGNYSACRCMTISYLERSLYFSFQKKKKKKK